MENLVAVALTDSSDLSAEVRRLLAQTLGFAPNLAKTLHNKPYLPDHPDLHISLTHTKGAVACAVFDCPVGVDIEGPRPVRMALATRFFTPQEQAYATNEARFLEVWTRKEALLKRAGEGINMPLCTLETISHPDITTRTIEGFWLSVCAESPKHTLRTECKIYVKPSNNTENCNF